MRQSLYLKYQNWLLFGSLIVIFLSILFILLRTTAEPAKNSFKKLSSVAGENAVATQSSTALIPKTTATPKPTPQPNPVASGRSFRVPMLMYHYISLNPNPNDHSRDYLSVAPDQFDEEMGYLQKSGFEPITLDTLAAAMRGAATLPPKPIVLTFDDGYVDLYYDAFPILRKYNFRAVAFIPTGLIGTKYYASWDQLTAMQSSGLFSFQAHSMYHTNLTSLSKDRLMHELVDSKKALEAKFGIPVNFMAYPYGLSNMSVIGAVKQAGYIGAVGTWYSTIQSEGTIYNMPRVRIGGKMDIKTFASKF